MYQFPPHQQLELDDEDRGMFEDAANLLDLPGPAFMARSVATADNAATILENSGIISSWLMSPLSTSRTLSVWQLRGVQPVVFCVCRVFEVPVRSFFCWHDFRPIRVVIRNAILTLEMGVASVFREIFGR